MLAGLADRQPGRGRHRTSVLVETSHSRARVIEQRDRQTGRRAEILLFERSIQSRRYARKPPAWAGTSNLRTDAQGRFRVEFPAEQVAEPRVFIALRISHAEFISRKSTGLLADLIRERKQGATRPFSRQRKLEPRTSSTPARSWCLGASRRPVSRTRLNTGRVQFQSSHTHLHGTITTGRRTTRGRIRKRMPKTHALALFVGPPQRPGTIPLRSLSTLLGHR